MDKCPKCKDPVQPGETFCGKCGTPIPAKKTVAKPTTSAPPPQPKEETQKKKSIWLILLIIVVVGFFVGALVIGIFIAGFAILGDSGDTKKYVENTQEDFNTVVKNLGQLETELTYESTAETEEEIQEETDAMEKELDNIDKLKSSAETAKKNASLQKTTKDTEELNNNLNKFYDDIISDMDKRRSVVNYFYQTQVLADKIVRASGSADSTSSSQDLAAISNDLQQFKFTLDTAIADFEDIEAPEILKNVQTTDIKMLKQISSNLGDMVLALQRYDDVGFISSYSRFESTLNEYNTKVYKEYQKKLDPEFQKLNQSLSDLYSQKDVIEDQYSNLRGKHNISGNALKLFSK